MSRRTRKPPDHCRGRCRWSWLGALLSVVPAAPAQNWSIVAPTAVDEGSSIEVEVRADSLGVPQGAAQFHLYYDPALWSLDQAFGLGGTRLDGGWDGIVNSGLTGELFAALWHLPAEPVGTSTLLTIRLDNIAGVGTTTSFGCTVDRWVDPQFVDIRVPPFDAPTAMTAIESPGSPPSCTITGPPGGSSVSETQVISFDLADPDLDPCDLTYEIDSGGGFVPSTRAGGGGSVDLGVPPGVGLSFSWDVAADFPGSASGVIFRITADDGRFPRTCSAIYDVLDTQVPPTCAITSPTGGSTVPPQALIVYDALDGNDDPLTLVHEFNGGSGYQPATPAGGGSHVTVEASPGTRIGFAWDAAADVGASATGVSFRLTVTDGRGGAAVCAVTFDVQPPGGSCPVGSACGDCNLNGVMSIVDSLVAAQIAASVVGPSPDQLDACNVSGSVFPDLLAAVDIVDALRIAQQVVGLAVTLICC